MSKREQPTSGLCEAQSAHDCPRLCRKVSDRVGQTHLGAELLLGHQEALANHFTLVFYLAQLEVRIFIALVRDLHNLVADTILQMLFI